MYIFFYLKIHICKKLLNSKIKELGLKNHATCDPSLRSGWQVQHFKHISESCHSERSEESNHLNSSEKPFLNGFTSCTNWFFFCLAHPLISFSLAIAEFTSEVYSKYTNLFTLYFPVKPFTNLFLCSYILRSKLFVTPVYKTLLFQLVNIYT